MKNILYLFCLLIVTNLSAQSDQDQKLEQEIIASIQAIDQTLNEDESTVNPALVQFEKLVEKHEENALLAAITCSWIGETLALRNYYKEAHAFYKSAYKYRKKEGSFLPQRWALKALMDIAEEQKDIKSVYNYSKEWMQLTNQYADQLEEYYNKTIVSYYKTTSWTKEYIIKYELRTLNLNLFYMFSSEDYVSGTDPLKYNIAFFKYALENFAPHKEQFLPDFEEAFEYMIADLTSNNGGARALLSAKEALKIIGDHYGLEKQAYFTRLFATLLRKNEARYFDPVETTEYEVLGIQLMLDYIKLCEQLDNKEAVLFAYRYIATRYMVLEDYQKAVQYLATSMKKCNVYKMADQVKYSWGGIQSMYFSIATNDTALKAAKTWQSNYATTNLTEEDIMYINYILIGR